MSKYKVVLLGGSNSVIINGLQKGLKQDNVELLNLSLGATSSIQNLYEIVRNRDKISSADLIISESNINDIYEVYSKCSSGNIDIIYRDLNWLYEELNSFQIRVMILILPYFIDQYNKVNNINRELVSKFNFNMIDLQQYYIDNNLTEFSKNPDNAHQLEHIMEKLGINIASNISRIKFVNNNIKVKTNPDFKIIDAKTIKSLFKLDNALDMHSNSVFREDILKIYKEQTLILQNNNYANYNLIGIHSWNFEIPLKEGRLNISKVLLDNKNKKIIKELASYNVFTEVFQEFELNEGTKIKIVIDDKTTEFSYVALSENKECKVLGYCDFIGFLIASRNGEYYKKLALQDNQVEVDSKLLYNFLIPDIKWVSDCINEYNIKMDPKKANRYINEIEELRNIINNKNNISDQFKIELEKLDNKISKQYIIINTLKDENTLLRTYGRAQDIVKNHLSYKIGNAIIKSKSKFIYILFLPIIIIAICINHRLIKNNKVYVDIKNFPDYNEYLKIKNFYSYKLGALFLKCCKMYFGGGLFLFPYKAYKLYLSHKNML